LLALFWLARRTEKKHARRPDGDETVNKIKKKICLRKEECAQRQFSLCIQFIYKVPNGEKG